LGEVFAVCMNKGGVGKTSLITNLAGVMAKQNKKVLIVDTDGQGNSAIAFGLTPSNFKDTVYDLFVGQKKASELIVSVHENIDLLPANEDMNFLEFDVLPNKQEYEKPFQLLKQGLEEVQDQYDYILIDTPPSMSFVVGNVLTMANKVFIPFVPEVFGVQGLISVVKAINDFKQKENPSLEIGGIIGMMVEYRTTLHKQLLEQVEDYCEKNDIHMFSVWIPKSIKYANAVAYDNKPATLTDEATSTMVFPYFDIFEEVLENGKTEQATN